MTVMTCPEIIEAFGDELAGVVAALAETSVVAQAGDAAPHGGYLAAIVADKGGRGTLYAQFDRKGAGELVRRALGAGTVAPESDVIEALKDVCVQAAASLVERRRMGGVQVVVTSLVAIVRPADVSAVLKRLVVEGSPSPALLGLWGTLELGVTQESGAAPTATRAISADPDAAAALAKADAGLDLEAILDLELPLVVRFGRTEMTLKALASLAPGAVIDLGRSPEDPAEVLVSNRVVARGEVVTVSGNYGVRITDVISAAERIRYMELAS